MAAYRIIEFITDMNTNEIIIGKKFKGPSPMKIIRDAGRWCESWCKANPGRNVWIGETIFIDWPERTVHEHLVKAIDMVNQREGMDDILEQLNQAIDYKLISKRIQKCQDYLNGKYLNIQILELE